MKLAEKSNNAPIFIHALFRTGSTYLWRKFREVKEFYCYYEPLHHFFLEIDQNYKDKFWKEDTLIGKELQVKKHFLHEYENLIDNQKKGLPYFKKSFIFDQYCKIDTNSELKKYINLLIENAKNKRSVLQFNRTALRTRWFKRNYPEALNIYIVRNPRDQWESCIRKAKKNRNIFVVMDLMIASLNLSKNHFYELAQHIPLIEYRNQDFNSERIFYDTIIEAYSTQEKYFIFYYIWLLSLIENILYSDMTININFLKNDLKYKNNVSDLLKEHGVSEINFDDAEIWEYKKFSIEINLAKTIENKIQKILFQSKNFDNLDHFFEKISTEDQKYLGIDKKNIEQVEKIGSFNNKKAIKRIRKNIICMLAEKIVCLKKQVINDRIQIFSKERQIDDINNSVTFKISKILLYPFKIIKKYF